MKPNIRDIKAAIYTFKKNYGVHGTFIKIIREETNTVTGQRSVERRIVDIRQIVPLPENLTRKFWYDVSYLKSNTNFTYGGEVGVSTKMILVEGCDLKALKVTDRDYFVLDHVRWGIQTVQDLEYNLGFIVTLTTAKDSSPYTVIDLKTQSYLKIYGDPANVP